MTNKPAKIKDIYLHEYRPQSRLVTRTTEVTKPRFPVVDAHNHLGDSFGGGWDKRPVAELLEVLDEAGVEVYDDLDGGWGEDILYRHLDHFKAAAPDRFQVFGGDESQNWLMLRNGDHVIGLFQGMFEQNILTFNPGWDSNAQKLDSFTDVREIQRTLLEQGVELLSEADEDAAFAATAAAAAFSHDSELVPTSSITL